MIKLLPHHVNNIRNYLEHRHTSNNIENIFYAISDIKNRTYTENTRGKEFVKGLDSIIKKIEKNPDMLIKIVLEPDDICVNLCLFIETCSKGDYSEINKAQIKEAERNGVKMGVIDLANGDLKLHREVALRGERRYARNLKIEIGDTYRCKDIFGQYSQKF